MSTFQVYGKLVSNVVSKVRRGDAYPKEHEDRVSQTFERALLAAAATSSNNNGGEDSNLNVPKRLKVLEVGIGSNCRTFQRGLYNDAFEALHSSFDPLQLLAVDFLGVDLEIPTPKILQEARDSLANRLSIPPAPIESQTSLLEKRNPNTRPPLTVTLNVLAADIVQGLPFPNDSFDCITSSLVLCSVTDPISAIQEIKRVLRPGGTFGFVEHVAVDLKQENEQQYRALEWQQRTLDPLQQLVAHNCHLHRSTDLDIQTIFEGADAVVSNTERFFVSDMWPVSCQCCGVVQKSH